MAIIKDYSNDFVRVTMNKLKSGFVIKQYEPCPDGTGWRVDSVTPTVPYFAEASQKFVKKITTLEAKGVRFTYERG